MVFSFRNYYCQLSIKNRPNLDKREERRKKKTLNEDNHRLNYPWEMIIAWLMEMTVYSRSMDFNQLSKIIFNSPKRLICWFQLIPLNRIRFFSFFFSLSKMKQKKNERNHCERLVDPYIFQFQCEKLKNCMQQYNLFI